MVSRLLRTVAAQALLHASLLLRDAGARLLPGSAPTPIARPGNPPSREEDIEPPAVTVHVPPAAKAMIAQPSPPLVEPTPEPLPGSLAARRKQWSLS